MDDGGTVFVVQGQGNGAFAATMDTPKFTNSGADVRLGPAGQAARRLFFFCTGDVNWTGGTYYVDTSPGPPPTFGVWQSKGSFTIAGTAKIVVPGVSANTGEFFTIIIGGTGFDIPNQVDVHTDGNIEVTYSLNNIRLFQIKW